MVSSLGLPQIKWPQTFMHVFSINTGFYFSGLHIQEGNYEHHCNPSLSLEGVSARCEVFSDM